MEDALARARSLIAAARSVAVLTGAGVSAESGIPTFRGAGGWWRTHRAEDLATPEAFARDPRLVWQWYEERRQGAAAAAPNPAHHALAALERRVAAFTLVTQNIDGLHQRAGSRNVIALHGDLWTVRCTRCGAEREDRTVPLPELPPRCRCGGVERPAIVWFGESLPTGAMDRAADAVAESDVTLVVGTSSVVQPAASLVWVALHRDIPVIEVNPEPTDVSARAVWIAGKAGEVLPGLVPAA
jgi:NAD-dependent deacetylase